MTVSSSFWYFCEFSELTVNKIPLSSPTKLEKGMKLLEQICRLFFRHELKYKTCYLNIRNFFLLWGWSNTRDWYRKTLEILKVWLEMILGSLLLDPAGSTILTDDPQRYIPRSVSLYFCESPAVFQMCSLLQKSLGFQFWMKTPLNYWLFPTVLISSGLWPLL